MADLPDQQADADLTAEQADLATVEDTVETLVLCRCRDARLGMRRARLWARMLDAGLINDPGDPVLRMLSVSAFIVAATANAPERSRVMPGLAVRSMNGGR